jgi:hypothetical protein
MRKAAFWTALVLSAVFAAGTASAAPPDKIVLKAAKPRGPITFNHKAHGEKVKECVACHHKDAPGSEQKCSKCHTEKTVERKLSKKEAFHEQCKNCHKKVNKGPYKSCDDCHKK